MRKIHRNWNNITEMPLLPMLKKLGIEMDQRLHQAWIKASYHPTSFHASGPCITDDMLIMELLKLNPNCVRFLDIAKLLKEYPKNSDNFNWGGSAKPNECLATGAHWLFFVPPDVLRRASNRTIKSGLYINWIINEYLSPDTIIAPSIMDVFGEILRKGENQNGILAEHKMFLERLRLLIDMDDDFQYLMTIQGDHIAFRIVSKLDDYYQLNENGTYVATNALLMHFGHIGLFTHEQIEELEELINKNAKEDSFQKYFEAYPHFLRRWDFRQIYPQTYLVQKGSKSLIPDFILTNPEMQTATILDLKCPAPKLIRNQSNRDRFAAAVIEARAQLLTYRRYFEDAANRRKMLDKLGMEIYHPHLAVIIGRSKEFASPLQRQQVSADLLDIEIVTYDDILAFAKNRRVIIEKNRVSS